jgi:hypothetical protein
MNEKKFAELADELAERDRDLGSGLEAALGVARHLYDVADRALGAFCDAARARGADHLADLRLGPVEPDDKRVDCLQFRMSRGRWELICVSKAEGKVTVVGPFKRGKPEKPCFDFPPTGDEVDQGLRDRLLELIRAASER